MYIAVDIGGTNIRVAFSSDINDLVNNIQRHLNVLVTNNYDTDLQALVNAIKSITNNHHDKLLGIGVGLPGIMSDDGKTIIVGANIHGWVGHQLGVDLEAQLGCKVFIENDDTIAAYGEACYGHGKNKNFNYYTWGTGFGGAHVSQTTGSIQVSQFEAGHHIVEWNNGRLCGCSQSGCAEAYIGGGNIQKYYGKKVEDLTPQEWDKVLDRLVQILLNSLIFYPTRLIVIGGGIAINQKDKIPAVHAKLSERLKVYPAPEIRVTEYGDDLGLYGAFALLDTRIK